MRAPPRPLRPAGTHAYVISPAGARKLLAGCPRANYHVDVAAWGLRALQLFCVNPLLAKQTHADTTIGGNQARTEARTRTLTLSLPLTVTVTLTAT